MLSDAVSDQIALYRKARGWNTEKLAEECAKLGLVDLTASVIRNIESGRRNKDGVRRRMVSVDELAGIASALSIPIPWLLIPYPEQEWVEKTPAEIIPTWLMYDEFFRASKGYSTAEYESEMNPEVPPSGAIRFYRARQSFQCLEDHERLIYGRGHVAALLASAYGRMNDESSTRSTIEVEMVRIDTWLQEAARIDKDIIGLRTVMAGSDYPMPPLPPALEYLDGLTVPEYEDKYTLSIGRYGLGATKALPEVDIVDVRARLGYKEGA